MFPVRVYHDKLRKVKVKISLATATDIHNTFKQKPQRRASVRALSPRPCFRFPPPDGTDERRVLRHVDLILSFFVERLLLWTFASEKCRTVAAGETTQGLQRPPALWFPSVSRYWELDAVVDTKFPILQGPHPHVCNEKSPQTQRLFITVTGQRSETDYHILEVSWAIFHLAVSQKLRFHPPLWLHPKRLSAAALLPPCALRNSFSCLDHRPSVGLLLVDVNQFGFSFSKKKTTFFQLQNCLTDSIRRVMCPFHWLFFQSWNVGYCFYRRPSCSIRFKVTFFFISFDS